jgi:hypothetical protein
MIKKSKFDQIYIGLIIGLLIPIITVFTVFLFSQHGKTFLEFIHEYNERQILTKLVSLCALPDLGIFYLLLNKQWYKAGKGVIAAVFMMVFWVLYMNFL